MTFDPGEKSASCTSSQWPSAPELRRRTSSPAIEATRQVEVAVIVVVRRRQAPAIDERAVAEPDSGAHVRDLAVNAAEYLDRLRIRVEIRDRDSPVGEDQVEVPVEVEVSPGSAPAGEGRVERLGKVRPGIRKVGTRPTAPENAVQLAVRIGDEEIRSPIAARIGGGDAHARVSVGHAEGCAPLLEAEPEAATGRDVQVEPVRIEVVGDIEIDATVTVDVGEHRAEPMLHAVLLRGRAS